MGPAQRFTNASKFRCFTGLAPKASETGQTDRKGQPITKAGNRLLRTTLVRAADHARRQDPQLARIYWTQMVQRGKDHLGAVCVVAAHLAERAWTVMDRGTPYVICDIDGTPVTPAQAKAIIADHWTVPEQVRRRRRSKKGKAPQQVLTGHAHGAQGARRRPSPPRPLLADNPAPSSRPNRNLDSQASIGNQKNWVEGTAQGNETKAGQAVLGQERQYDCRRSLWSGMVAAGPGRRRRLVSGWG
jgi:hypothetical protein